MTRVCTKCRQRKELTDFSPNKRTRNGREHICKRCRANARRLTPRKRCGGCNKYTERHRKWCTPECEARYRAAMARHLRGITGYHAYRPCDRCQRLTRAHSYCKRCASVVRSEEIMAAKLAPRGPGPKVCGQPILGGWCPEVLQFGTDRAGYTVEWCSKHGERRMRRGAEVGQPRPVVERSHGIRPRDDDEEAA